MDTRLLGLAAAIVTLFLPSRLHGQESPLEVVRTATRAVQENRVAMVSSEWAQRLAKDSTDRTALLGLATLARLTHDVGRAEELYQRAIGIPRTDALLAWAHMGLGALAEAHGNRRRALTMYQRAREVARRIGDRTAEGMALAEAGFATLGSSGRDVTLAMLDSASRLLDPGAIDLEARRRRYEAVTLVVSGDASARRVTRESVALARRSGDVREEAAAQRTLALHFSLSGMDDSVLPRFAVAESLFQRGRDCKGLAYTLLMRADYLWQRGLIGAAKQAIERAHPEAEASHYREGVGHVHVGLASVAMRVADYARALEHAGRAIATYDSLGDRYPLTLAHSLRAQILVLAGDFERAQREAPWLHEVVRTDPDVNQRIEAQQVLVALALATGRIDEAERALDESERSMRSGGMGGWASRLRLSRALLARARGDTERAGDLLASFLREADTAHHVPRYEGRALLAETHARRGRIDEAVAELRRAANELDAWRRGLDDRELRTLAFQAVTPLSSAHDAGVARVLNAIAMQGRPRDAFELAEARRARELSDRIAQRTAQFASAASPAASPRDRAGPGVTASEVAAALPEHTALLEYVTGPQGAPTTLFVVSRSGVVARAIAPEDSLRAPVARFVGLLEAGADPRALARSLGAALLGEVHGLLPAGTTRLIVVPDGVLHGVPFDVLHVDGAVVIERFAIAIAPSARVAMALARRRPRSGRQGTIVAFGDPAFPDARSAPTNAAGTPQYLPAFASTGGLPRLEASAREARMVARYAVAAHVYERGEASAARLKRLALGDVAVLHLATHALVNERSIQGSVLALAPGDGESGFLTPDDLAHLRTTPELVVLSACRSAGGSVVQGEGVQGLTAPLLEGGARSVVATRWRIGDERTVPFVEALYDGLAEGLPVADALRAAKLDAIRRGAPPGEWGAFQVIGDPMLRIPLRAPRHDAPIPPVALLLLLSALAAGAGIYLKRKGRASDRHSVPSSPTERTVQR